MWPDLFCATQHELNSQGFIVTSKGLSIVVNLTGLDPLNSPARVAEDSLQLREVPDGSPKSSCLVRWTPIQRMQLKQSQSNLNICNKKKDMLFVHQVKCILDQIYLCWIPYCEIYLSTFLLVPLHHLKIPRLHSGVHYFSLFDYGVFLRHCPTNHN